MAADMPGDRPAPKSPNRPDRWGFCETHAAEYNRGWNYFEGLSAEEALRVEAEESGRPRHSPALPHYSWGGPGDGSRLGDELHAFIGSRTRRRADFEAVRRVGGG